MKPLSRVPLFATPWTVARQAPQSKGFSRQEYWGGLPFPSPGDLPDPGMEAGSPALQADALPSESSGKQCTQRKGANFFSPCCMLSFLLPFKKSYLEVLQKFITLDCLFSHNDIKQRKHAFFVFLKALSQLCFTWSVIPTRPCSCVGMKREAVCPLNVLGGMFQAAVDVGEGPHLWV